METQPMKVRSPLLDKGKRGMVVSLDGDPSTQNRLRELGLLEFAEVKVLNINGSVRCQVNDSRFGIDRQFAENLVVVPVEEG